MGAVKSIGVREFRNNVGVYLSGQEPIAISRHGKVIGFYLPVERNDDEIRSAVEKLGATVEKVLEESGMTEDELARWFDFRRPVPE